MKDTATTIVYMGCAAVAFWLGGWPAVFGLWFGTAFGVWMAISSYERRAIDARQP